MFQAMGREEFKRLASELWVSFSPAQGWELYEGVSTAIPYDVKLHVGPDIQKAYSGYFQRTTYSLNVTNLKPTKWLAEQDQAFQDSIAKIVLLELIDFAGRMSRRTLVVESDISFFVDHMLDLHFKMGTKYVVGNTSFFRFLKDLTHGGKQM